MLYSVANNTAILLFLCPIKYKKSPTIIAIQNYSTILSDKPKKAEVLYTKDTPLLTLLSMTPNLISVSSLLMLQIGLNTVYITY